MAVYELEDLEKQMVALIKDIVSKIIDGFSSEDIIPLVNDLLSLVQKAYEDLSDEDKTEKIQTAVRVLYASGMEIAFDMPKEEEGEEG